MIWGSCWSLQELDLSSWTSYRQERKELPAELEELEAEFEQAGGDSKLKEAELKGSQGGVSARRKARPTQLEESQSKYKQQLLAVKTNREYSALLTEIESRSRRRRRSTRRLLSRR